MHLRITSDENVESGVGEVVDIMSGPTRKHFLTNDYGAGLLGVVIVLMCRNPALSFRRRIRFAKKDKKLYMDIMLDFNEMKVATPEKRRQLIVQRIENEVAEVVSRYTIEDFDRERFLDDLKTWLNGMQIKSLASGGRQANPRG